MLAKTTNAGNIANDNVNQYVYDGEGRLCAVNGPGGMIGYMYDSGGNRVAKGTITSMTCDPTANGFLQTAGYVVGPAGEQLTEVDANNQWTHTNVYAGGRLIATYGGSVTSPTVHYYIDDPLGTRRAQASAAGELEAVYVSLPYGDYANSNGIAADPTENHFTGKERDQESGNDDFGARYYNSATGRWLIPDWSASVEPVPYANLANPQTLNLYAYSVNNPLGVVDVDGHDGCSVEGVGTSCSSLNEGAVADASAEEQQADSMINAVGQGKGGEGSSSNIDKRNALAEAADKTHGSDKWAKGTTGWKCNIFVCNMLAKVGMSFGDKVPNAGQWSSSDPNAVPNWRVLGANEAPMGGDVVAYSHPTSDATGHTGIVTSANGSNPYITAAGQYHVYTQDANTFSGQGAYSLIYRRYTGN